jgi:hypothetical protein
MGKRHSSWYDYYWSFLKEFGKECYKTWRTELFASVIVCFWLYVFNQKAIDLEVALVATIYTLLSFALVHISRIPWLLYKQAEEAKNLKWGWGVFGIAVLAGAFAVCVYTGLWFYTMQPQVKLAGTPDARDQRIVTIEAQLNKLKVIESPVSLRRRTIKLSNEIFDFWQKHPTPSQPVQNPANDDERKRNKDFDDYWRTVDGLYKREYKERLLGIVREYKGKGVATGYLEAAAENHTFGASAFSMIGSPVCSQDEICQFRELAFHVDAQDQLITTNF